MRYEGGSSMAVEYFISSVGFFGSSVYTHLYVLCIELWWLSVAVDRMHLSGFLKCASSIRILGIAFSHCEYPKELLNGGVYAHHRDCYLQQAEFHYFKLLHTRSVLEDTV
jgi:hypothetical protein